LLLVFLGSHSGRITSGSAVILDSSGSWGFPTGWSVGGPTARDAFGEPHLPVHISCRPAYGESCSLHSTDFLLRNYTACLFSYDFQVARRSQRGTLPFTSFDPLRIYSPQGPFFTLRENESTQTRLIRTRSPPRLVRPFSTQQPSRGLAPPRSVPSPISVRSGAWTECLAPAGTVALLAYT